jgi:cob(I)alamin adenosyltransferase
MEQLKEQESKTDTEKKEPPKSMIYTRTGDKGTTSLFNGARVKKDHLIIRALGDLDELNAQISHVVSLIQEIDRSMSSYGWAKEEEREHELGMTKLRVIKFISEKVIPTLMDICSHIATPITSSSEEKVKRVAFDETQLIFLEKEINQVDFKLPRLKNFILPLGNKQSTQVHICRAVCRRSERSLSKLVGDDLDENVFKYINRLSSYLFVTSRFLVYVKGDPETIYCKKKNDDDKKESQ